MSTNKLTDLQCRRATEPGTKLWDGGGLFLHVSDAGHITWRQKYRIKGKQRIIVHGEYGAHPKLSLSEARNRRDATKVLLAAGLDPVQQRRTVKTATIVRNANTVETYARTHYEGIRHQHRNPKHSAQWINSLQPLFDKHGTWPLADVTTADLVAVIAPVIKRTPETGRRLRQRVRQVFPAALEERLIERDPAVSLHTNKRLQLPKREEQHIIALPWVAMPAFITALHEYPAERMSISARAALEFAILTAGRTGEVIGARWDEIDTTAKTWTIPGARMKMNRTHVVPLSDRALAVLDEVRALSGESPTWVFPSPRNPKRPLSTMALLMAIRRLGYQGRATTHGFRSAFSSWAYERTHYREDVIEMSLAHVSSNKVKAAYLRSDFLRDRVTLMQMWSDCVTGQTPSATVVDLGARRA